MRHIPNLITLVRILFTPWIGVALARHDAALALLLTFLAGISDFFDGMLARKFGWGSALGAVLDPIADKVMVLTIYIGYGFGGNLPWWLVGIVLGRDVVIVLFGALAFLFTKVRSLPPSVWGKISTFWQMLLGGGVVMRIVWPWLIPQGLLDLLMYVVAACTIWSGVHYAWLGRERLRGKATAD